MSQPMPVAGNPYLPPTAYGPDEGGLTQMAAAEQLKLTGYGLRMLYVGILLIILGIMAMFLRVLLPPMLLVGIGLLGIGSLLTLAGQLMCLTVPAATGARQQVIFSIVFLAAGPVAGMASVAASAPLATVVAALGNLATFVGWVLFVLFMRRLAVFLRRDDLRSQATSVLYGLGFLLVAGLIIYLLLTLAAASAELGPAVAALAILGLVGALIVFVMYANLVNYLSRAIAERRAAAALSNVREP